MSNEIPKIAIEVFQQFNFNGGSMLEDEEVIQNNQKRKELGIDSIYKVSNKMTLESFYQENRAIFEKKNT